MEDIEHAGAADDATRRADAFRRLAEGSLHDAYRLSGAILRDPSEARDAVHDAFISAWRHYPSLRDPTAFDAWFRRIVVNTCRERLRRRSRRPTSDIAQHVDVPAPEPALHPHDRVVVLEALACLDPGDRALLALRYYRDLKVDDIAAVLDLPAGTVKSRLSRAHARLREVIERSHPEGGRP